MQADSTYFGEAIFVLRALLTLHNCLDEHLLPLFPRHFSYTAPYF
jgi:hypothetical protein